MHDCFSTTHPNITDKQAWRAGFREGVKMCLDQGRRLSLEEFPDRVYPRNLSNLGIWHNVGIDVDNGAWAMLGARQGTKMCMLDRSWDHKSVQDFDELDRLWSGVEQEDPIKLLTSLGQELETRLAMPVVTLDPKASAFFKRNCLQHVNRGVMVRE